LRRSPENRGRKTAVDREKIFSTNTLALLRLAESAPRLSPRAA
jgi:hypothetical protein